MILKIGEIGQWWRLGNFHTASMNSSSVLSILIITFPSDMQLSTLQPTCSLNLMSCNLFIIFSLATHGKAPFASMNDATLSFSSPTPPSYSVPFFALHWLATISVRFFIVHREVVVCFHTCLWFDCYYFLNDFFQAILNLNNPVGCCQVVVGFSWFGYNHSSCWIPFFWIVTQLYCCLN